jgi:hypothetical protein
LGSIFLKIRNGRSELKQAQKYVFLPTFSVLHQKKYSPAQKTPLLLIQQGRFIQKAIMKFVAQPQFLLRLLRLFGDISIFYTTPRLS